MNTIKKIYKQFGGNPFQSRISELHSCLVLDTSPLATQARRAHAEGRLLKDEAAKAGKARK